MTSLAAVAVEFMICSALILASGVRLSRYGDIIAEKTGLGGTWIGLILMATVTSLPEVVVSAAAVRIGAIDMAAANLFGSNLFNIAVLGVDDLLYRPGPILLDISQAHLLTLAAATTMTGIAIIGLTLRARRKRFRLSWDALAIIGVYVVSLRTARVSRLTMDGPPRSRKEITP